MRFFTNSWHLTRRSRHKQRTSRILRKLFAIGISMQNESRLYREMIHNGKSRSTFDLYSSPSANSRKLPLCQLANPFRVLFVCGTFNVRNCAKLGPRVTILRISHARRKWSEQSAERGPKTDETWPDVLQSLFTVCQTEILGYNRSIGYKCHRVIISQVTLIYESRIHGYYWSFAENWSTFTPR